jgi:hypothetical protein
VRGAADIAEALVVVAAGAADEVFRAGVFNRTVGRRVDFVDEASTFVALAMGACDLPEKMSSPAVRRPQAATPAMIRNWFFFIKYRLVKRAEQAA